MVCIRPGSLNRLFIQLKGLASWLKGDARKTIDKQLHLDTISLAIWDACARISCLQPPSLCLSVIPVLMWDVSGSWYGPSYLANLGLAPETPNSKNPARRQGELVVDRPAHQNAADLSRRPLFCMNNCLTVRSIRRMLMLTWLRTKLQATEVKVTSLFDSGPTFRSLQHQDQDVSVWPLMNKIVYWRQLYYYPHSNRHQGKLDGMYATKGAPNSLFNTSSENLSQTNSTTPQKPLAMAKTFSRMDPIFWSPCHSDRLWTNSNMSNSIGSHTFSQASLYLLPLREGRTWGYFNMQWGYYGFMGKLPNVEVMYRYDTVQLRRIVSLESTRVNSETGELTARRSSVMWFRSRWIGLASKRIRPDFNANDDNKGTNRNNEGDTHSREPRQQRWWCW